MKKIISLLLILVIAFSVTACDGAKKEQPQTTQGTTLPLDTEELKTGWETGALVFPNGKTVTFPCTLKEFVENTGAKINNTQVTEGKILAPGENLSFYVSAEGTSVKITVKNTKEEAASCMDADILKYNYNNTNEVNRQIKFAGTLSPGVSRSDVEKALEIPEGRTVEDKLYIYEGKNEKNKNVKLTIAFNSDNIVNSVSYEIVY